MPRTRTLAELRSDSRQLADQENSTFISDAELNRYVNQSMAELWQLLVSADQDRYLSETDIVTTTGTERYTLPADFLAVRFVRRMQSLSPPNEWGILIREFPLQEVDRHSWPWYGGTNGAYTNVRYRVISQGVDGADTRIWFRPDPGNYTYRVYYVSSPPELVNDADEFDGVAGWEEWVALDAAIKMMQKEESDPSILMAQRQRVEDRIKVSAGSRDMSGTSSIALTRRRRSRLRYPRSR